MCFSLSIKTGMTRDIITKHIAFCDDCFLFRSNRILDDKWARRFPGALWLPTFANIVRDYGFTVATGDIALSHIQAGYWKAENVIVIQSGISPMAEKLIKYGAKPWVLTCFESPLMMFVLYDEITDIAQKFEHVILFSGLLENLRHFSNTKCYPLYFPVYNEGNLEPVASWSDRKFMVVVASNKYWKVPFRFSLDPYVQLKFCYGMLRRRLSRTWRIAVKDELQTKRLELIEYFGKREKIDVYGEGWNELERLPRRWRTKLKLRVLSDLALPVQNKVKTISEYKFSVCFENVAYPGYFTEKIIDCFVAGVIPIYLGAPDIENYIRKDAYIDMRDFGSWQELEEYLERFSKASAIKMISAGREYLESPRGKLHAVEGFAEFIGGLLPQFNN